MTPKETLYVAGPMRGIPFFNFPAFDEAEEHLLSLGYEVVSPAQLDREAGFDESTWPVDPDYDWKDLSKISGGFTLHETIQRDLDALKQCTGIYMLDGWENSTGAKAELHLAKWLGLDVLYQTEPRKVDGQTVVNEEGGKQSFILADFDCIPPECLRLLAQCLGFGKQKYGKDNWKKIAHTDNLSHAMNHINEWRRGDRTEPHLVNTMARVTFALWQAVDSGEQIDTYVHPDMT